MIFNDSTYVNILCKADLYARLIFSLTDPRAWLLYNLKKNVSLRSKWALRSKWVIFLISHQNLKIMPCRLHSVCVCVCLCGGPYTCVHVYFPGVSKGLLFFCWKKNNTLFTTLLSVSQWFYLWNGIYLIHFLFEDIFDAVFLI